MSKRASDILEELLAIESGLGGAVAARSTPVEPRRATVPIPSTADVPVAPPMREARLEQLCDHTIASLAALNAAMMDATQALQALLREIRSPGAVRPSAPIPSRVPSKPAVSEPFITDPDVVSVDEDFLMSTVAQSKPLEEESRPPRGEPSIQERAVINAVLGLGEEDDNVPEAL